MNIQVQQSAHDEESARATALNTFIQKQFPDTSSLRCVQTQPGVSYLFNLNQKLGAGACGSVYRSYKITAKKDNNGTYYQADWNKPFAAKISLNPISENSLLHNIWKNEARMQQAQCDHAVHASGKMKNNKFIIISDLIPGKDAWNAWVKNKKIAQLSFRQRTQIASQILMQLNQMHSQGFVHLDIKLDNMLFDDSTAAKPTIHFCDFAFSKEIDNDHPIQAIQTKSCTPQNLAPEQLLGGLGYASDIYALTPTLLRLFGAKNPFTNKHKYDPETQMTEMSKAEYDFAGLFEGRPAAIPDALSFAQPLITKILQKMQAPLPGDRPSAEALLKFFLKLNQLITRLEAGLTSNEVEVKEAAASILSDKSTATKKAWKDFLKTSIKEHMTPGNTAKARLPDKLIARQMTELNTLNQDQENKSGIQLTAVLFLCQPKDSSFTKASFAKVAKIASQNLSFTAFVASDTLTNIPLSTLLKIYLTPKTTDAQAKTNAIVYYNTQLNETNSTEPANINLGKYAHALLLGKYAHALLRKHGNTLTEEKKQQLLDVLTQRLPFNKLYHFYNKNSKLPDQAKVEIIKQLHKKNPAAQTVQKNKKTNKETYFFIHQWAASLLSTSTTIDKANQQILVEIVTETKKAWKTFLKTSIEEHMATGNTAQDKLPDELIARQMIELDTLNQENESGLQLTATLFLCQPKDSLCQPEDLSLTTASFAKVAKIASQNLNFTAFVASDRLAKIPLSTLLMIYLFPKTTDAQAKIDAIVYYNNQLNDTNSTEPAALNLGQRAYALLKKHGNTLTEENKQQLLDVLTPRLSFNKLYNLYNKRNRFYTDSSQLPDQAKVKIIKQLHTENPAAQTVSKNKKTQATNEKNSYFIRRWAASLLNTSTTIDEANKQTLVTIATEKAKPKELAKTYNRVQSAPLRAAIVEKLSKHPDYAPLFPQKAGVKQSWIKRLFLKVKTSFLKLVAAIKGIFHARSTYKAVKNIAEQEKAGPGETPTSKKTSKLSSAHNITQTLENTQRNGKKQPTPTQPSVNQKRTTSGAGNTSIPFFTTPNKAATTPTHQEPHTTSNDQTSRCG